MMPRKPCPRVPGSREDEDQGCDVLCVQLGQRRSFRGAGLGLLLPRARNKSLTALWLAQSRG